MIMKLKKRPGPHRGCRAMEEEEETSWKHYSCESEEFGEQHY
jgi:hypothetical protein